MRCNSGGRWKRYYNVTRVDQRVNNAYNICEVGTAHSRIGECAAAVGVYTSPASISIRKKARSSLPQYARFPIEQLAS